ncbi:MAG: spore coat associated protein CotJA [Lachnospiraceae bacterium]|nr:spore coat associated protein CotJA [Lachnospiraceae bacterium]
MNHSSNQRCGCPCRPQMQAPPCINTNCGCEGTITPPLRPMMPPPPMTAACPSMGAQSTGAMRPSMAVQPTVAAQPSVAVQPSAAPQTLSSVAGAGSRMGNCGCGASGSLNPDRDIRQMPIGMGYVPWQKWGQTYPIDKGFSRGTIFPDLDLPFAMGRCR